MVISKRVLPASTMNFRLYPPRYGTKFQAESYSLGAWLLGYRVVECMGSQSNYQAELNSFEISQTGCGYQYKLWGYVWFYCRHIPGMVCHDTKAHCVFFSPITGWTRVASWGSSKGTTACTFKVKRAYSHTHRTEIDIFQIILWDLADLVIDVA